MNDDTNIDARWIQTDALEGQRAYGSHSKVIMTSTGKPLLVVTSGLEKSYHYTTDDYSACLQMKKDHFTQFELTDKQGRRVVEDFCSFLFVNAPFRVQAFDGPDEAPRDLAPKPLQNTRAAEFYKMARQEELGLA